MARSPEAKIRFSVFNKEFREGITEINKDTQRFRKELKLQETQMKHTASETGKLEHNLRRLGREKENVRKKIELTEKQLEKAKEYYGENSEEARKLQNQLLDLQISEQRIENAIIDTNKALEKQTGVFGYGITNAEKYRKKLTELGTNLTDLGDKMQRYGRNISSFGRNWSTRITAPIVATGGAVFKLASDWESSWIGVEKVIEGTDEQLAELQQGLRDMTKEMPQTHTEIAEVAAAAGQLGIATEHIQDFSKVMLDMGVSTNMSSDEAATSLARLSNITQMSADDYDRLGATIVGLGNNLATTEKEIVEMGLRLAGAGKQIGLTEAETLALGGALSSVGIAAEAGGSAFSKLMINMQLAVERGGEDLKAFANVAGLSSKEFKKAFEDDAAGAIITFIDGLADAEKQGKTAIGILDEIGITEVRMRDSLLRAAGASDLFTESLKIGKKSWEENIALTEEAEKRYGSTESQLKIMWNRIKDTGITVGEVLVPAVMSAIDATEPFIEKIQESAEAFSNMDEEQQRTILKIVALTAAIGPASLVLGSLTTTIGGVVKVGGGLLTMLGSPTGKGIIGRLGMLAVGAGPVGWAIAGLTGLAGAVYLLTRDKEKLHKVNWDLVESLKANVEETDDLISRYEELELKNRLTKDEMLRYMDILTELEKVEGYDAIKNLTEEQEELLKKSGMTNDEMDEFLRLNGEIIEKAPDTARAISEQGNAYAENLDKLKELNAEERERLMITAKAELGKALENEVSLLEKQKDLVAEINELNKDLAKSVEDRQNKAIEITETENNLKEIQKEIKELSNATTQEEYEKYLVLLDQEKSHIFLLEQLQKEKYQLDKNYDKIIDSLGAKDEILETTNEEIRKIDALKYEYEDLILSQVDLTAERGRGLKVIQEEIDAIEQQRKELEKQTDPLLKNSQEYQDQIYYLEQQKKRLVDAKTELDRINEAAGRTIFDKHVHIKTNPNIQSFNDLLARPINKEIRLQGRDFYAAYKDGTNFHPGGPALIGEEGPELVREGRKWSLADLGFYNLRRGAQVFTAEQTSKILSLMNRIPAYASGVGVTPNVTKGIDRMATNLARRQESIINNQMKINIKASDVILEGRTVGKVMWEPVEDNMNLRKSILDKYGGE